VACGGSVLTKEFESLNEIRREEESPHERVAAVKFKREQVDAF